MMSNGPILQLSKQRQRDYETFSRSHTSKCRARGQAQSTAQGSPCNRQALQLSLRSWLAIRPNHAGKLLTVRTSWQELPGLGPGRVSRKPVCMHLPFRGRGAAAPAKAQGSREAPREIQQPRQPGQAIPRGRTAARYPPVSLIASTATCVGLCPQDLIMSPAQMETHPLPFSCRLYLRRPSVGNALLKERRVLAKGYLISFPVLASDPKSTEIFVPGWEEG